MLFILTGEIQSGKTRWLEGLITMLTAQDILCCGVVAPGVWCRADANSSDLAGKKDEHYEKRGINNVLLPSGQCIAFAKCRQNASMQDGLASKSQSEKAPLAWAISDEAIARVNAHLGALEENLYAPPQKTKLPKSQNTQVEERFNYSVGQRCFLIIDELGRLELQYACGLTSAVHMLKRGSAPRCSHALVVARTGLAKRVEEDFSRAWGGSCFIAPNKAALFLVSRAFGLVPCQKSE